MRGVSCATRTKAAHGGGIFHFAEVRNVMELQVDLLRRWREGGRQDRDLFDALLASVGGIAQGLQSTG